MLMTGKGNFVLFFASDSWKGHHESLGMQYSDFKICVSYIPVRIVLISQGLEFMSRDKFEHWKNTVL